MAAVFSSASPEPRRSRKSWPDQPHYSEAVQLELGTSLRPNAACVGDVDIADVEADDLGEPEAGAERKGIDQSRLTWGMQLERRDLLLTTVATGRGMRTHDGAGLSRTS